MKKIVRIAKPNEEDEILKVYSSGGRWLPYTDTDEIRKCIRDNGKGKISLIVIELDNKIVGALKLHRPQSHIGKGGKVAVLPDCRGQGIGKILYKAAIKLCYMEGRIKFTDSLVGENQAVTKMFESLNFTLEAKMRKHTPGGLTLYQFAYYTDEQGVPELNEDVEFNIPLTDYMKDIVEKNKEKLK
jgi:GNAT superfamily N-acetyltransferase